LYPVRDAVLYVPTLQYALPGKAFQGEMLYAADNPPYGAVFTYQLKDGLKTLKQKRIDAEKAAEKAGQPIRYPSADELRAAWGPFVIEPMGCARVLWGWSQAREKP
jgi:hypothetical protein